MAEGTYEYECMRAELLGIEKPDYEEFMKKRQSERKEVQEEELDTVNLQEADLQEEGEKRVLGGLEELNTILQKTQVKINRFKASCGSLTNLLKIRVTGKSESSSSLNNVTSSGAESTENAEKTTNEDDIVENPDKINGVENGGQNGSTTNQRKSDLSKALDRDMGVLDSMLEKAENAQYSMEQQRKQMKKFLN